MNKARYDHVRQSKVWSQKNVGDKQTVRKRVEVVEGCKQARKQPVKQVWQEKCQVREEHDVIFRTTVDDRKRLETCAEASLGELYTIEILQDFLHMNGLGSIRVKPLGAKEVLLEF